MKERVSNIEKSKRFQELKRLTGDYKCGDHNIMQDPENGELLMKKVFMTNEPKTAQKYYDKYDARTLRNYPFLIQCYDFSFQIQSEFCSKFYVLHAYYEYPYDDLEKIFTALSKTGKFFTHEELMTLFYQSLESLCHMQAVSVGYGYLQLYSIFKDTSSDSFKLIDNFSNLGAREFYFNLINSASPNIIIAPEVLSIIYQPSSPPLNLPKVDVFNLGLIILTLGNLLPLNDIYDFGRSAIIPDKLAMHIKSFEARYSHFNPLLIEVLHQLLILDPNQRPFPSAIKSFFPSFSHFQSVITSRSEVSNKSSPQTPLPLPQSTSPINPFQFKYQPNFK
jgi:hypothetical protein